MCGIAGVLYRDDGRLVDPPVLRRMADSLAHRGPDGEGFWTAPGVGLAHRRLAIIDLTTGSQPLGNEDGSVQVVFNGELYNFEQLRIELEQKGHSFRTRSDTEVLVHLYEEHGDRLVERLRGMFAFALWDAPRKRLLLARDRVGIKPLYVYRDGEKLLFGSELKAILAYPDIRRVVDAASLQDYLAFGMVAGHRTIFRGIEKLPAAHTLSVTPGSLDAAPRRYWQLRIAPDTRLSAVQWQEAVRAKVQDAVRTHLIADVPVGAFLSGGLDSSIVVTAAAEAMQEPLRTFSIGFPDQRFSELPYARDVAERCGTLHVEDIASPQAAALVDSLTEFYDEPFADSSAIPTFMVSRLAARSVKVVLSGDGGDEAFGGYARYAGDLKEERLRRLLPEWFRVGPVGVLGRAWPKADWLPRPMRAKTLLTNLSMNPGAAYGNTMSICRPPLRNRLLSPDVRAELNGHDPLALFERAFRESGSKEHLGAMIAADVAVTLPDNYLVKVDRASMAVGLEVRPPLLDHELLELCATIPSRYKIRSSETKWIAKEAYRQTLPDGAVRRPKHGFEMPVDEWLRGPLRDMFQSTVLEPGAVVGTLINQKIAQEAYQAHYSGTARYGNMLWSLLVLARWSARYL